MYSRSALSSEYIRPAGSGGSSMLCCPLPCGRREWRVLRHNWTSLIAWTSSGLTHGQTDARANTQIDKVRRHQSGTHPTMVAQRSKSWSWMDDSHPFRTISIGPPIPEIRLFQTLTLKLKGQGHVVSPVSNWLTLFSLQSIRPIIPEIQLFRNLT